MTITLELSPDIEAALRQIAAQQGLEPKEWVNKTVIEHITGTASATFGPAQVLATGQVAIAPTIAPDDSTPPPPPVMLDQALAGRIGTVRSNKGRGGSRLSENTGEAFAEYVAKKHREGHL